MAGGVGRTWNFYSQQQPKTDLEILFSIFLCDAVRTYLCFLPRSIAPTIT